MGDSPFVNAAGEPYVKSIPVTFAKGWQQAGLATDTADVLKQIAGKVSGAVPELTVKSAYRDPAYNAAVGGAKGSQHTSGHAVDLDLSGYSPEQKQAVVGAVLSQPGVNGFGVYDKNANVIHFDTRQGGKAYWGADYTSGSFDASAPDWVKPLVQNWAGGKTQATDGGTANSKPAAPAGRDLSQFGISRPLPSAVPPIPAAPLVGGQILPQGIPQDRTEAYKAFGVAPRDNSPIIQADTGTPPTEQAYRDYLKANGLNMPAPEPPPLANRLLASGQQGITDVLNTGGGAVGWLVQKGAEGLAASGVQPAQDWARMAAARNKDYWSGVDEQNKLYEIAHANDAPAFDVTVPGLNWRIAPTVEDLGRFGGQALAQVPAFAFGGELAAGAKAVTEGAPYVGRAVNFLTGNAGKTMFGRAASRAVPGAAIGAAATGMASSANPDVPVGWQMASGAAAGAGLGVTAPAVFAAAAGGARWLTKPVMAIMSAGGEKAPAAVVNQEVGATVQQILAHNGLTIQELAAKAKADPSFTLGDAGPGLKAVSDELAAKGGAATKTMDEAMSARAANADAAMNSEIDKALGPKPDVTAETTRIIDQGNAEYAKHRANAVANTKGVEVNIKPVVADVKTRINQAKDPTTRKAMVRVHDALVDVGATKMANKDIPKGQRTTIYETSVTRLADAKKAIDDWMRTNRKQAGTAAWQAMTEVRNDLRARIHNASPDMAAADAARADAGDVSRAVDFGKTALDAKTSFEDFQRAWGAATPAERDAMRLGARNQIGTLLEGPSGAAEGAVKLFGKGSAFDQKLNLMWGDKAAQARDAVYSRARQAETEAGVARGAKSAQAKAAKAATTPKTKEGINWRAWASGWAPDLLVGASSALMGNEPLSAAILGGASHIARKTVSAAIGSRAAAKSSASAEAAAAVFGENMAKIFSASGKELARLLEELGKRPTKTGNRLYNATAGIGALGYENATKPQSASPASRYRRLGDGGLLPAR